MLSLLMTVSCFCFAQNQSVEHILSKSQMFLQDKIEMHCSMNYNLYPTLKSKDVIENYDGLVLKNEDNYFIKINNTIFLNKLHTNKFIKLNTDQKLIQYTVDKNTKSNNQSLFDQIKVLTDLYKNHDLTSEGNFWVCTLSPNTISQLPYSKVQLFVNKDTNLLSKQVLYFSSQMPYKEKDGTNHLGNPRLEILISDYKFALTQKEKELTLLSHYIIDNESDIRPSAAYKTFKIIQD
ncbi:hypothetical protein MUY34_16505 [Flavihalobacter algicola]|uniref:GLPGLI family protein n=2 Tax=Psychroserpens algicola TaxID=1719034 RepID=A0ABT0HCY9_9FLAO|nr:hypothetical protein [Psychroserpens algicola]